MEQWGAVAKMRRKWNGTVVGCGANKMEMEWNSRGLWLNRGERGMEQWRPVVEMRRKWNGTMVDRGANDGEME